MIEDIDNLLDRIGQGIRDNVPGHAIIGMSGGADSTLTAILCKEALGSQKVISVHMPYGQGIDVEKYNANSIKVAEKLDIATIWNPITDSVDSFIENLQEFDAHPKSFFGRMIIGNVKVRTRMNVLYSYSNIINGRVIGTGNLSEDFIGYDTKGGDALADIFPIGELVKSEVYQLLEYFRDEEMIDEENIDRVPSAGLWEGQTDEEELGFSYDEMERSVKKYFKRPGPDKWNNYRGGLHLPEVEKFVLKRHFENKHKHEAPKVISGLREFCN